MCKVPATHLLSHSPGVTQIRSERLMELKCKNDSELSEAVQGSCVIKIVY